MLNSLAINESVLVERDGAVGWIVLNRAAQLNAINDEIRFGVPQALQQLEQDPAIRVIVFRGAGERGFCAGADIKEKRAPETAIQVRQRMEKRRWIETLDRVAKPVIAAVHGYCMGGGMELALACDIRYAAPNAQFALPETGLGLIPGGGGTQRLARVIGPGRAMDMLLTGERVSASEALRTGLVTRLSDTPESLLDEVNALAQKIAGKPPAASAAVKQAARGALELELKSGLDLELNLFALLAPSGDVREAALAFAEKREPHFTGN